MAIRLLIYPCQKYIYLCRINPEKLQLLDNASETGFHSTTKQGINLCATVLSMPGKSVCVVMPA